MKKKHPLKKTGLLLMLLALFLLPKQGSAQVCPYDVVNNLNCPVIVQVAFVDCNGIGCYGTGQTAIAANSTLNITACTSCTSVCNVIVTLIKIDGISLVPAKTVSAPNPNKNGTIAGTACTSTWMLTWGGSQTDIDP